MYTIFSCPKDFINLFDIIQRNAINSWLNLSPKPDIILFGVEDYKIKKKFKDTCIKFVPIKHVNDYKTPFINKIFEKAIEISKTETLCYVNSDIILFNDFPQAIKNLQIKKNYFGVGRRYNVEINNLIDFSNNEQIKMNYFNKLHLDIATGSDYFIFRKNSIKNIPNFLIGRTCWDNWLIHYASINNLNLTNCTIDIFCIHQNHNYSHIKTNTAKHYKGVERNYNFKQLGGIEKLYTINDCHYYLKNGYLKIDLSFRHLTFFLLRKLKFLYLKEVFFNFLHKVKSKNL